MKAARYLPNRQQEQLLRAALLDDASAVRDAYARWSATVDLVHADHDAGSIMPLVYDNLTRLGIAWDVPERLTGTWRAAWYRNQLLIDSLAQAAAVLRRAAIPFVVTGSAGVALAVGERYRMPLYACELLVARGDLRGAVGQLQSAGWSLPDSDSSREEQLMYARGVLLRRDGGALELRWSPLEGASGARVVQEFWSTARLIALASDSVAVADSVALLLRQCGDPEWAVDGRRSIRWVAEAAAIVRSDPALDWERLAVAAGVCRRSHAVAMALAYLDSAFRIAVPAGRVQSMRKSSSRRERMAFSWRVRRGFRGRVVAMSDRAGIAALDGVAALPSRLRLLGKYALRRMLRS